MKTIITIVLGVTLAISCTLSAAAPEGLLPSDPLYRTILQHDNMLFDAYNVCDLPAFSALVTDDIEFYHDKGGLSIGKAPLLKAVEANICHKVKRELLPETLEVYPLANYGAVEIGVHTFCNLRETPVCTPETNGRGKFIQLWKQVGNGYQLARVVSYDHLSSWEYKAGGHPATLGAPTK